MKKLIKESNKKNWLFYIETRDDSLIAMIENEFLLAIDMLRSINSLVIIYCYFKCIDIKYISVHQYF